MSGDIRMSTELAVAKLCPAGKRFGFAIEQSCIEWSIQKALHKAYYVATLAHESMGFTRLVENMNYGEVGLLKTWPHRFNAASAKACARNPEAIANRVYADRMGNGSAWSGDGWKYRGGGLIMITGKDNHRACSMALFGDERLVIDPTPLREDPMVAARAAGWFWHRERVNDLIDTDTLEELQRESEDIRQVRMSINGGVIGLEDFKRWLRLAKQCFTITGGTP